MTRIVKILIFFLLTLVFSCEKQGLLVKCSDCLPDEPTGTDLNIQLSHNNWGSSILVNVWEGNLEDSVLYDSFTSGSTTTSVSVTLNKKYTVTATYNLNGNTYVAVDAATPRVRYTKDQCNDPCYFIYDKNIDLRLK